MAGCSITPESRMKASSIIGEGVCFDIFVSDKVFSYQHQARLNNRAAFAIAVQNKNQFACAWASGPEVTDSLITQPSWEAVQALALSKCELVKKQNPSITAPCKIFARDTLIVWDEYKDEKFELQ